MLDKLKKLAEQAKEKAGPMAEQAAQKANELAAEAKVKAGPLAEQAKERATELAVKAAPAVSQGIDKATGSIDKATSGRFTEHLTKVQTAAHDTADKVSAAGQPSAAATDPVTVTPAGGEAPGTGGSVPATISEPADDITGPAAVIAEPTAGTETGPLGEQPPGNISDASEALAQQAAEAAETVQGQASYSAPSVAVDSDGPDAGAKPLITDEKA